MSKLESIEYEEKCAIRKKKLNYLLIKVLVIQAVILIAVEVVGEIVQPFGEDTMLYLLPLHITLVLLTLWYQRVSNKRILKS